MIENASTISPLYPPTLSPPDTTLGLFGFLKQCARNPLATIPQAAYQEQVTCVAPIKGFRTLWLSDPDLIEDVLVRNAARYRKTDLERRIFDPVLGRGVLTAEAADWRWQRRLLAPLFRPAEVRGYIPDMVAAAQEQIAAWRAAADTGTPGGAATVCRPIDDDMTRATYAVILRTMLYGGAPGDVSMVMASGQRYLDATPWLLAYGLLQLPTWLPRPGAIKLRLAARAFRSSVSAIIADRRTRGGETGDLLGRLLAARDPETDAPLTDALLVDNLATLLEAGHETTAKALTWCLYILARAPEWQDRIRTEVEYVAGQAPLAADHVDRLVVTERVLKEALRLYPPAPIVSRTPAGASQHSRVRSGPGQPDCDADLRHPPPPAPMARSRQVRTGPLPAGAGS